MQLTDIQNLRETKSLSRSKDFQFLQTAVAAHSWRDLLSGVIRDVREKLSFASVKSRLHYTTVHYTRLDRIDTTGFVHRKLANPIMVAYCLDHHASIFSIRLSVILHTCMYTVSHKNDTDVGRYNFDVRQPILTIMSRNVTQRVRYQNNCLCTTWGNMNPENCIVHTSSAYEQMYVMMQ